MVMIVAIILFVLALGMSLILFVSKRFSLVIFLCAIGLLSAGGLYCYFMQYDLVYSLLAFGGIAVILLIYMMIKGGKREL